MMPRRKQDTPLKVKALFNVEKCSNKLEKELLSLNESLLEHDVKENKVTTEVSIASKNMKGNGSVKNIPGNNNFKSEKNREKDDTKNKSLSEINRDMNENTVSKTLTVKDKSSASLHLSSADITEDLMRDRQNGEDGIKTMTEKGENATNDVSQKYLMESILQRQRQIYEQCPNNWINVQRTDNNCLSKSKAERYRWCVQESDSKTSNNSSPTSHVANLKKSTSLIGIAHPIQEKLYSTVFTGASKFRCRDCGRSFNTLVNLTVHMNKTGHYRDENLHPSAEKGKTSNKGFKSKKSANAESEVSEFPEKVLKCMGCGYSFDSLQDLSVHMMKTKHYEQVPSLHYWSQRYGQTPNSNSSTNPSHANEKQKWNNNVSPANIPSSRKNSSQGLKPPTSLSQPSVLPIPGIQNMAELGAALAAQSQGLFGYSPYFMPMPFSAFNNYAANPALAAAAASLLFSNPWLAQMPSMSPNLFPNFLGSPANIMKPGAFSRYAGQQLTPDSPSPPRSSSIQENKKINRSRSRDGEQDAKSKMPGLNCTKCKESFTSVQSFTDHIKYTGHFPKSKSPLKSESGSKSPGAISTTSDQPSTSMTEIEKLTSFAPMHNEKRHVQTNSNKRSRFVELSSPQIVSKVAKENGLAQKYLPQISPSSVKSRPDKNGSVDFIKSLESTIQSAISKVTEENSQQPPRKKKRETPPDRDFVSTNQRSSFTPFSNLSQNYSSNHSDTGRSITSSPLDLSNNDISSSKSSVPKVENKQKGTQDNLNRLQGDKESDTKEKDHLKCIRENMRSLFAYMNYQNANIGDGKSQSLKSPESNYSYLTKNQSHNKISNDRQKSSSFDETSRKSPSQRSRHDTKRASLNDIKLYKRSIESSKSETKSPKSKLSSDSILRDLFIPKEDEKVSTQNPLIQMENLVNHQLGSKDYSKINSKRNPWPRLPNSVRNNKTPIITPDKKNNESSPMSALLNFFAKSNSYIHRDQMSISSSKVTPNVPTANLDGNNLTTKSPQREDDDDSEQLRIKMAYFLQSMANAKTMAYSRTTSNHVKSEVFMNSNPELNNVQNGTTFSEFQMALAQKLVCSKLRNYDDIDVNKCKEALTLTEEESLMLSKTIGASQHKLTEWFECQRGQFEEEDRCDFIIINNNRTAQFHCSLCAGFQSTSDVGIFIQHIHSHADERDNNHAIGNASDSSDDVIKSETKSQSDDQSMPKPLIKCETMSESALLRSPASESGRSLSGSVDSKHSCVNGRVKMEIDPIQVSS